MMRLVGNLKSNWIYLAGFLLILPGFLIRFFRLTADPPFFFKGVSRALITDPYNLTYFARNKVLFGVWDLFDYPRWVVFKYSLASMASYISFSLFGVSRITANLSAVFLNLLGLILFIIPLYRKSKLTAFVAALILVPNMPLIVYGRYPFLENGLIFLCGFLFWMFNTYYSKKWMPVLSGLMVALCILSGKMFGVVMIVPILAVYFFHARRNFIRLSIFTVISVIVALTIVSLIYYGGHIASVYLYLHEQTIGMYGIPNAFYSPITFVEQLMTFGGASKFIDFMPFLILLLFVALVVFVVRPDTLNIMRENRELVFCLGWLISSFFLLMIDNYRPLRYQLFMILPMAGIIGTFVASKFEYKNGFKVHWFRLILLVFICWYFAEQFIMVFVGDLDVEGLAYQMVWISLPVGVILAGLIYLVRKKFLKAVYFKYMMIIVLIAISSVFQYRWIYKWFSHTSYSLRQAGEDLNRIVGEGAVITGPFAQTLTIDNELKSFIYMFGMVNKEPNLFDKIPITHLALDESNIQYAFSDYPELAGSTEIAQYNDKNVVIRMIRVSNEILNQRADLYRLTDYENSNDFFAVGDYENVQYFLNRFVDKYPDSKAAKFLLVEHHFRMRDFKQAFEILSDLRRIYPLDYSIYFHSGFVYYKAYRINGQESNRLNADRYFKEAVELNPNAVNYVPAAKAQADSMFAG
jgi:4-amino-4-deoxy-L-arabinose transferase-like glycosyltransferase